MPKLHFYDSGLVCWLLGIRTVDQLRRHPLRGAVFETWVASEIVKHRVHRGETRGLFHYRDRHGTEADLLLQTGSGLCLVEAKAGATVAEDAVAAALGKATMIPARIVHGGDTPQAGTEVAVIPWSSIEERSWV